MPEGDSVYRLAIRLRAALDGQVLTRAELRFGALGGHDLAGRTVLEHDTYGKHLLTRLSGGLTLHTHLRMSGSWTITGARRSLPSRLMPDVRALLATADRTAYGLTLPVVELVSTAAEASVIGHLGPDPLRADWDPQRAAQLLRRDPGRAVSAALLDQTNIAGLGNLWANELCFLRGVHPAAPMATVEVDRLVSLAARALRASATVAGQLQVTTGNRRRGESHWVAGRANRPCLRCGTPVRALAEDRAPSGRRTWWCPRCQPRQ